MPVDWSKYPKDWQVIRNHILTLRRKVNYEKIPPQYGIT